MTAPATPISALDVWVQDLGGGRRRMDLLVPDLHCAGCIRKVESGLGAVDGVTRARVNLSTKRVLVEWAAPAIDAQKVLDTLETLGFAARPFDAGKSGQREDDARASSLLRALAVAGFAAANVMLLSVSVWSGAEDTTRELFHWISALIAVPAAAYAGRPFFRSAGAVLRHGRVNMDVPISLGIVLAVALSLFETATGGVRVYFDASLMLCFFLLAGRYLDHMMRARARSAVTQLLSLSATGAQVVGPDGERRYCKVAEIETGMVVAIAPGERVPVDGRVINGTSDLDRSIVTGEAAPEAIGPMGVVEAGTLNLTGPLQIEVTAAGRDSFLSQVIGLMETAEQGKDRYVRLADRAAQIYAPLVHIAAAATFAGWMWWSGDWHLALVTAIAVLIITCPCALGLAVPAVQMVASGRLFRHGIMVKDGSALERLAEVDVVVLDKTGTLTLGQPELVAQPSLNGTHRAVILALARESLHPLAKALVAHSKPVAVLNSPLEEVTEVPGAGLSARYQGKLLKLGSHEWCLGEPEEAEAGAVSMLHASLDGEHIACFLFQDKLRPHTDAAIAQLKALGLDVALLSGDREDAVMSAAHQAGISRWQAGAKPGDKVAFVADLERQGQRVLMVGDGINDAPALAAAHASMAPASATDIGRTAAGLVFTSPELAAVPYAVQVARSARRLVHQNFALAALYNLIAVPIAVLGFASPLIAAIAMSSSSIVVTANALRLYGRKSAPVHRATVSAPATRTDDDTEAAA
ncbi:MAG: cadmium-translocating P-type ATPase [Rhizobiales bacterium]|nr:cadmium-translocating P-type ATPase [Hyphomicrobiales bacterium]